MEKLNLVLLIGLSHMHFYEYLFFRIYTKCEQFGCPANTAMVSRPQLKIDSWEKIPRVVPKRRKTKFGNSKYIPMYVSG